MRLGVREIEIEKMREKREKERKHLCAREIEIDERREKRGRGDKKRALVCIVGKRERQMRENLCSLMGER